jgi:hypothetical protein
MYVVLQITPRKPNSALRWRLLTPASTLPDEAQEEETPTSGFMGARAGPTQGHGRRHSKQGDRPRRLHRVPTTRMLLRRLQQIPGDERADLMSKEDTSPGAQALLKETPAGRAIPIIYIVAGILSIPVIWDTIREMLRREYYGGVVIDARQTPAVITHDKALPANIVLFIDPDGHIQRNDFRTLPEDVARDMLLKIKK